MRRALVIADDLSGAAEIAGIGTRFGLPTRLALDRVDNFADGLTVIDSDSRSLPPVQAAQRVGQLISGVDSHHFDFIYKKTDSALRGHIVAELSAVLHQFDEPAALLLPQNPSRGRVIVD